MTKPIMLITGSSRGVGLACAQHFNDSYSIVGVARTPGEFVTELGDITDPVFREMLVEKYTPKVFINNAGVAGSNFDAMYSTNIEAAGFLLLNFYKKMLWGHIINVSSVSANISGRHATSLSELTYKASKVFLKNLSNNLSNKRAKPLVITSLEPDYIYTDMIASVSSRPPPDENYTNYKFNSYTPMQPEYIAQTIEWIISQPPWVCIKSLEISNAYELRQ